LISLTGPECKRPPQAWLVLKLTTIRPWPWAGDHSRVSASDGVALLAVVLADRWLNARDSRDSDAADDSGDLFGDSAGS